MSTTTLLTTTLLYTQLYGVRLETVQFFFQFLLYFYNFILYIQFFYIFSLVSPCLCLLRWIPESFSFSDEMILLPLTSILRELNFIFRFDIFNFIVLDFYQILYWQYFIYMAKYESLMALFLVIWSMLDHFL